MRFNGFAAFAAVVLIPGAAWAQPAAPACTAIDAALPAGLVGWMQKTDLAAAASADALDQAAVTLDKAYVVELRPTPGVAYVAQPEKPGGSVSFGGLVELVVTQAGVYRVALGAGPWIDVVKDGKAVQSIAHGHGPACSTVRKMVDFDLKPGRYIVQVSANAEAKLPLMVSRLP